MKIKKMFIVFLQKTFLFIGYVILIRFALNIISYFLVGGKLTINIPILAVAVILIGMGLYLKKNCKEVNK